MTPEDGAPAPAHSPAPATRAGFLERIVHWLRAGYPTGVPPRDYVVLLGLLQRRLTEVEVHQIVDQLTTTTPDGEPITREEIEKLVREAARQPASDEDVMRVSAKLVAGGWPLAGPPST